MREIKFRAYDKNDGMFYNIQDGIEFSDLSHYTFRDFLGNPDAIGDYHKWEIMQFTGLKDKNGKEIYEGDILQLEDEFYKVEFRKGKWMACNELYDDIGNYDYEYKIIGNIYENKDLIN